MKTLNTFLLALVALIFTLAAQATTSDEIEFLTEDGIKISASYQLPAVTEKVPAVILIHQGGSSRKEWQELALWNKLIENGYAVLAYDVRLHGKSGSDKGDIYDLFNNPKRAPLDLQAAIKFLQSDKRIDASRIGIVGASIGGNLGCVAASSDDYNVKSVVVMSAKTSAVQNLSGQKAPLSPKNAFYIASENEQGGAREAWAKELYELTSGSKKVAIAKGNKHGSYILRDDKKLEDDVVDWIKNTL